MPQRVLTEIVGVTAPRISQIAQGQPADIDRQQLHDAWLSWQEWPADRLRELSETADDLARAAGFRAYVHDREPVKPNGEEH